MLVTMRERCLSLFLILFLPLAVQANQVVATVGDQSITGQELERAIGSSPFANQFPSMDEKDQAALRGNMLERLIASRLLYLEAKRRGLDNSAQYHADVAAYQRGLYYRAYMQKLRAGIEIPDDEMAELREQYKGEPDALAAAKSQVIGERYKLLKLMALERLKEQYGLKVHEDRIKPQMAADTLLAEAKGLKLHYRDIRRPDKFDAEQVEERLYNELEVHLVAMAAEEEKLDISVPMQNFDRERLPSLLLSQMARSWIPNEQSMRDYFQKHSDLGLIPERRHVAQIVLASREEAEAMRKRILDGESLFRLASEHSIDPFGRKQAGDMGWMPAGKAMPEIEAVLEKLPDNQISEVVKTQRGYHLLLIQAREAAVQKPFEAVRDRVRQAMLNERFPVFLKSLEKRYPVEWKLPTRPSRNGG